MDIVNSRRDIVALGTISLAGMGMALLERPRWEDAPARAAKTSRDGIPNVPLTTHTGARVRFYDDLVRDKLVVINMMYASCSNTCPPTTQNLLRVQQMLGSRIGRDIFMYSITLRPDFDSPPELAHYAKIQGVRDPGWLFLTGNKEDIERLRLALGFYDPDPAIDGQEARHTGMVRIGNDAFKRWGMVPGMADPRQIVSSILHADLKRPQAAGQGA
ncbi:MAG TPA: SCO family protein [Moraxellaceae bacterium]|nr:SCO family protein [Moraxellaceae bacterium]